MATDIDKIFQDADAAEHAPAGPDVPNQQNGQKAPTDLAAKVAAKRGKAGASAKETASLTPAPKPDAASTPLAATDGVSPNAKDELAKLAAKNEAKSGKGKGKAASSVPTATDATAPAPESADAEIPTEIPGLTSTPADGSSPNAFEVRQAELAAARARSGGGKKPKLTAAQQRKVDAAKAKEKATKEKAKAKEKTDKQKAAEATRANKKKEEAAARKKREDERKAKVAADKAERAKIRASKATPDLLKKMPKQIQELFAAHYKSALEDKIRRPKCDRGDFCSGWLTLLTFFRKNGVQMPAAKAAPEKAS